MAGLRTVETGEHFVYKRACKETRRNWRHSKQSPPRFALINFFTILFAFHVSLVIQLECATNLQVSSTPILAETWIFVRSKLSSLTVYCSLLTFFIKPETGLKNLHIFSLYKIDFNDVIRDYKVIQINLFLRRHFQNIFQPCEMAYF